jgi:uncharacterized protein (TIGR02001 family)
MLKLVSVYSIVLLSSAFAAIAQEEQDPGEERAETAEEVKAEDAEAEKKKGWLPGGLSGNVAVYTDYSFRGVSQTGRSMALQGGMDYNHDSGLFAGIWGSSTNFANTFLEMDFYGGYAGAIDDFSYKLGATFFFYPRDEVFNYWEFWGFTGYDFGITSVSAGFIGSPDYFGTLGTGIYIPVGFAVPLPTISCPWPDGEECFEPSFDANGGYTHTEKNIFADQHYFDWNMGLVLTLPFNLKLDFRYVDTDVKDVRDADARFVFGAKYLF